MEKVKKFANELSEKAEELERLWLSQKHELEAWKPLKKSIDKLALVFEKTFYLDEWSEQVKKKRVEQLNSMIKQSVPTVLKSVK